MVENIKPSSNPQGFTTWAALIHFLDQNDNLVYYKAPLDRHPIGVIVTKRFKNGKLRVKSHHNNAYSFTVDETHLDRFRKFWTG
jgi:hypothetical protein